MAREDVGQVDVKEHYAFVAVRRSKMKQLLTLVRGEKIMGMILYGIGWTLFLLPNDITTGGVPGIASIVYFATGFPVQYTYFAINAVLLMVSRC